MPPRPSRVAGVPVLHRRVLDVRVVERDQLHHRGVQLILVAHRRGASFEVAHRRALFRDDQRPFELSGLRGVDPEVRRELHRATHARGDVAERSVGEHGGVQGGKEVVSVADDRTEVLAHQLGVVAHRVGERAEDHADLGEARLERRRDRNRVDDGVDGDSGESFLLGERDPELLEHLADLRIDLIQTRRRRALDLRGRPVTHVLVVDRLEPNVRPRRRFQRQEMTKRAETPFEQPFRFVLLRGDEPDDRFRKAFGRDLGVERRDESVLVLAVDELLNAGLCLTRHDAPRS